MAIQISSDGRTFTLQTEKSSYQMMADVHDVLLHLYYGRKIAAENLEERIFRSDVGFAAIRQRLERTEPIRWMCCRRSFRAAESVTIGRIWYGCTMQMAAVRQIFGLRAMKYRRGLIVFPWASGRL